MTNQHGGVNMDGDQEDAQVFAMSWTAVNRELIRLDQDVRELRLDVKRLDEKIDTRIEEVRKEIRDTRVELSSEMNKRCQLLPLTLCLEVGACH